MAIFDLPDFDGHEQVGYFTNETTGLKAIIAVHNTNLGPALGGCRIWAYKNGDEAATDVLRLSKGMTYKAAMAGLALGGGKSVIIADAKKDKTPDMMRAMGRAVDSFGGRYIIAEDVGSTVADMDTIREETPHVSGVSGGAGDPSPSTAHGVAVGVTAAIRHKLGRDSAKGVKVAVQGVGNVGYHLCEWLHRDGAELFVTDINEDAIARCEKDFGATRFDSDPKTFWSMDVDVLAPCALGAGVNDETVPVIKAPIVAGAANNVLAEERHGEDLRKKDVLYAPDYVINAGGLIDVARFKLDMDTEAAKKKLLQIDDTLSEIFRRSDADGLPTSEVADTMAEERFMGHKRA